MKRLVTVLIFFGIFAAGCEPAAILEIRATLELEPPECLVGEARGTTPFLLDIGADADTAHGFHVVLQAALEVTNAELPYVFIGDQARTFFTLPQGELLATPTSAESSRISSIGGSAHDPRIPLAPIVDGTTTSLKPVVVDAVTREEAIVLQTERDVVAALRSASDRVPLVAHIQFAGIAMGVIAQPDGNDDTDISTLLEVRSQVFDVPIHLCRGCLVPNCPAGERPTGLACQVGLDVPLSCGPE